MRPFRGATSFLERSEGRAASTRRSFCPLTELRQRSAACVMRALLYTCLTFDRLTGEAVAAPPEGAVLNWSPRGRQLCVGIGLLVPLNLLMPGNPPQRKVAATEEIFGYAPREWQLLAMHNILEVTVAGTGVVGLCAGGNCSRAFGLRRSHNSCVPAEGTAE